MSSTLCDVNINAQDVAKLHNEINQLRNQQFLIAIAALSFVGVAGAWLIPEKSLMKGNEKIAALGFAIAISVVLHFLLGLMFFWVNRLGGIMARISTYLVVRNLSAWEVHHTKYVKANPKEMGQRTTMSILFLAFGMYQALIPFALSCWGPYIFHQGSSLQDQVWWGILILSLFVYVFSIGYLGFRDTSTQRLAMEASWRQVIRD